MLALACPTAACQCTGKACGMICYSLKALRMQLHSYRNSELHVCALQTMIILPIAVRMPDSVTESQQESDMHMPDQEVCHGWEHLLLQQQS